MKESDLRECEEMWTTNREKYILTDDREPVSPNGRRMGYGIFELSPDGQLHYVLIEDSALHEAVSQRMLDAGVTVVSSPKEALALAKSRGAKER